MPEFEIRLLNARGEVLRSLVTDAVNETAAAAKAATLAKRHGALMVFVHRIALPAPLAQTVMLIAAASFYIYLFNIFPIYLTDQLLGEPLGRFWLPQIVLSLMLGLFVYSALERSRPLRMKLWARWVRT